jgi:glycosyltransferase involved in cell wall biosynthesis
MRENLQEKGVPSNKIVIVHNFPERRFFSNGRELRSWPRNPDKPILLYCGTITDHYRLDVAVKALAIASKSIPGLRLRIAGEGNRLSDVRRVASELSIAHRVEFLGTVNAERVPALMAAADIGISSHQAGVFGALYFSNKILEYISQGLPVVCSRTETLVRYIPEDAIAYFSPGNSEDMARQILRLWNEPSLTRQSVANARALTSRYSWENEQQRLLAFYQKLVA